MDEVKSFILFNMRFFILLFLCCFITQTPMALAGHQLTSQCAQIAYNVEQCVVPKLNKKLKKRKRRKPPRENLTELAFLQIALYLSVAAGASIVLVSYLGLIFTALFLIASFFWFLSGILVMMGIIILLARTSKNQREQNEQVGWLLLLLLFTRIGFFVLMAFLFGPIAGIVTAISFIPTFIGYIVGMASAFGKNATKKDKRKMWRK